MAERWQGFFLGLMIAGWCLPFHVTEVHAYSDLFRFNDRAVSGGGGGRWFTGSPADSYGCDVCHESTTPEPITVSGLPDGYEPGAQYEISVIWSSASARVNGLVEITDTLGRGAGYASLAEPPLTAAELCQPNEGQIPAALLLEPPDVALDPQRQLIGMQDCGGSLLRWRWTAPAQDIGPLFFAGGVVAPDQHRDALGDRVSMLFKTIGSPSQPVYRSVLLGSCCVGPDLERTSQHPARTWLIALVAALAVRSHRRWTRSTPGNDQPRSVRATRSMRSCRRRN